MAKQGIKRVYVLSSSLFKAIFFFFEKLLFMVGWEEKGEKYYVSLVMWITIVDVIFNN